MSDHRQLLYKLAHLKYTDLDNKVNEYIKEEENNFYHANYVLTNIIKKIVSIKNSSEMKNFYDLIDDVVKQIYSDYEKISDNDRNEYGDKILLNAVKVAKLFDNPFIFLKENLDGINNDTYKEFYHLIEISREILVYDIINMFHTILY